jgi:hypothetical protein
MHRAQLGLTSILFLAALALSAAAQEPEKKKPAGGGDAEQLAKSAQPGPEHKQLARLAGQWKTEARLFYGPGEPQVSEGTARFRMILGGRYLQQDFRSEFGGQQYRGMGVSGYDNAQKKYVGTWIDTMSTGIMRTEGEYDEKTHTFTETGVASTPEGEAKMKMVSKYVDNDKFIFTMYEIQPDGTERKSLEITYTRQPPTEKKKR